MSDRAARAFTDLNGREWLVVETEDADIFPDGRGLVFECGTVRVELRRRPRRWPHCSEDELRAALTLAHIYERIGQGQP